MMNEAIEKAAEILAHRRLSGTSGPPLMASHKPHSIEHALAIQAAVTRRLEAGGDRICGWKCVLPAADKISVAPIFQNQTWHHGPCHVYPVEGMAAIEPEFGFVLAQDLKPGDGPFTAESIKGALRGVHLVFELIQGRFQQADLCSYPELLADGLFNQGILLGPRIDAWPAAHCELTLAYLAIRKSWRGAHPNLDSFAPVVWLVNYLTDRGITLEEGAVIITGSYAGVLKVPFDTPVSVSYGSYGSLAATFTEKNPSSPG